MAQDWSADQRFSIDRDGRVAVWPPNPGLGVFGVVARDLCFSACYTMTRLNSDYRLEPQTRYRIDFQHAPNRMELFGPAGFRIVAIRVQGQ
jgi:hypothetical protein